jgi:hypothetical protein
MLTYSLLELEEAVAIERVVVMLEELCLQNAANLHRKAWIFL